jgi:hypothetical protein
MEPASERGAPLRWPAILVTVFVLATASAVVARWILFSRFSYWDDEGYFLLALRLYARSGGLYDRIETIYGPLYFEALTGLSRLLGCPLDNVSARWLGLFIWLGTVLGCFALVLRATRSLLAAAAAYVLCFPFLIVLRNEPLHPSHSIVFLLPILALAVLGCDATGRSRARYAGCGALVAALLLIKLNVGAFALLAFAVAFLREARGGFLGTSGRGAATLLLAAVPFLLMRPLFSMPWVRDLALLETVSLVPFGLMPLVRRGAGRQASCAREALAFTAGGTLVAVVVLGIALSTGTTLGGMWRALIVETARFPATFSMQPELPPRGLVFGAVAVGLIAAALHRGWPSAEDSGRVSGGQSARTALALLKLAAAAALLLLYGSTHWPLAGLPFVWLLSMPVGEAGSRGEAPPSRWLIGLLVVAVSLQVYPVAGTQIRLSAFLVPALAVIGFCDALGALGALGALRALRACGEIPILSGVLSRLRAAPWRIAGITAIVAVLGVFAHHLYQSLSFTWSKYAREGIALDLPGAESLRLSEGEVAVYRWLVANLKRHGTTFFGVPGVHSLYLWAGEEPPVPFYSHVWMISMPPERQQQLADVIAARPDLCVVRNRSLCDQWLNGKALPDSPIAQEIERDFKVVAVVGGFELLIPRAKEPDLILSAIGRPLPVETPDADRDRIALRLVFDEVPSVPLERFELVQPITGEVLCDSAATAREERMIPADERGREIDSADGRRPSIVLCPSSISRFHTGPFLIRCYDKRGEVVARLLVVG